MFLLFYHKHHYNYHIRTKHRLKLNHCYEKKMKNQNIRLFQNLNIIILYGALIVK